MNQFAGYPALILRLSLLLLVVTVSGCTLLNPEPEPVPEVVVVEPEPEPEPTPPPAPPPPISQTPSEKPAPAPVEPATEPLHVAVLLSDRKPAYEKVAIELERKLENIAVFDLTDKSLSPSDVFAAVEAYETDIVVAIGLRAAKIAKARSTVPVVFAQVFNTAEHQLIDDDVKGVAVIPPLDMQIREWKKIDPELQTIGAIIGSGHENLIAEAIDATEAHNLGFRYEVATSDRETLYLFTQLAQDIDGYWLFPDNRILSVPVLRQMLRKAAKHGIQVSVFNESLLKLGAAFSATSVDSDIAAVIVDVLTQLSAEGSDAVPPISPLTEMSVKTNDAVLRRLKLASASASH